MDLDRWRVLLDVYRDAQDDGPEFIVLRQAHSALTQARADLDRHCAVRPAKPTAIHRSRPVEQAFARDIAELAPRYRAHTGGSAVIIRRRHKAPFACGKIYKTLHS